MSMKSSHSPFRGWIASLSNGETIWETPPEPGKKTAWQSLLDRLTKENLKMTGLRVQRGGITLHALSPKMCDGYYHAYEIREIMWRGGTETRQACGSVIGDMVLIFWIDDGGNVWQDVRPLNSEKLHSTLRNTNDTRSANTTSSSV
jgi:hypothetical protein